MNELALLAGLSLHELLEWMNLSRLTYYIFCVSHKSDYCKWCVMLINLLVNSTIININTIVSHHITVSNVFFLSQCCLWKMCKILLTVVIYRSYFRNG